MGCAINHKRELGCWNLKGQRVDDMFANVTKKLHVSYVSLSNSHICVINHKGGIDKDGELLCSSM